MEYGDFPRPWVVSPSTTDCSVMDGAGAGPPPPRAESRQEIPANANEGCVGPAAEEAGKAAACAGCPNRTACASGKGREVDPGVHVRAILNMYGTVEYRHYTISLRGG